jgi:hypothetical protein
MNLQIALFCVLQVAVFYPNKGEYEIQLQARSRAESPQITSGKGLNFKTSSFCDCLFSWRNLVITKFKI